MKFRHYGDLHLDRDLWVVDYCNSWNGCWFPEVQENESEQTLVLTGDLADSLGAFVDCNVVDEHRTWIGKVATRFKNVVVVLGNHDIYHEDLLTAHKTAKSLLKSKKLKNVYLLENDSVEIDGVKIFGATFWTDYNNRNEVDEQNCNCSLRDFYVIKNGESTSRYFEQNKKSRKKLESFLKGEGTKMVVTHHAPSEKSSVIFKGGKLNFAFVNTRCEHFFEAPGLKYWIHGHTHEPVEYQYMGVWVSSNPRGYNREGLTVHNKVYEF